MTDLSLRCTCGAVRGTATNVGPDTGHHLVCYCDDCQAFARFLGREDLLDEHGGTAIYQMTPSQLRVDEGRDRIRSMRLSDRGMVRFYVDCCKTPIGNTLGSQRIPFVGVPTVFLADGSAGTLGPQSRIQGRFARGGMPAGADAGASLRTMAKSIKLILRGFVRGAHAPSCLYDAASGRPVASPRVLGTAERDALR